MTILLFIITILILVIIHELGHFLVAKKFNIKVLEFGFGLPPRVFGKKWGETLVSLNWLPLGGFVRLLGEDDADPRALADKRSFAHQGVWKRIAVVVAGVSMNLGLAWMLFYITLFAQGFKVQLPLLAPHTFIGVRQANETVVLVNSVASNSPAASAKIESGDRVVAINGREVEDATDLIESVKKSAGEPTKLTLSDIQKNRLKTVEITPRKDPPAGEGALGVALGSFQIANLSYDSLNEKILSGPVHSYNLTAYSLKIFGQTVVKAVSTKDIAPVSQNIAGPVGITRVIGQVIAVANPLIPYLEFLAMLSLNLAIINLLPFPGLDGGRLIFLLVEALIGKRVPPAVEKYIHSIGLVVLIGLIILVTASDIQKLF